jgi:hypothetical protein
MSLMALSNDHKVTARTSAEVAQGLRYVVVRQQARGLKFGIKRIGIEGVIGAVLLEFLARPEHEQNAVIDRWLPELGAQVGGDYATDAPPPAPYEAPPHVTVVDPIPPTVQTPVTPRSGPAGSKRPRRTG